MLFSIITVSLNPGKRLWETMESIRRQTFTDYEVVIKDGGSADGSLDQIAEDAKIRIVRAKDSSIYDAMNQAVKYARGEYFIFMNCGDLFASEDVLARTAEFMKGRKADIYYGDQYLQRQKVRVPSPLQMTDFVCYRNIPCHQVCFYHRRLFAVRGYDTSFPVRADYEHFLWCKYEQNAVFAYMDFPVCAYEGAGFSEQPVNERAAKKEHKMITERYIGRKCLWYHFLMLLSLQPLRKKLNESRHFTGIYQKMKRLLR